MPCRIPSKGSSYCAAKANPATLGLRWQQSDDATGYTIWFGIAPDKLYSNIMVYGRNEYWFKGMDKDLPYYFQIEAFNENGIGKKTTVLRVGVE